MACCAGADGAVVIWLADSVALLAATHHRRRAFRRDEWMRRAFRSSGLILFCEGDLFRLQSLLAINRRPGCCCVTAAQEFLINTLVAGAAVSRGKMCGDYESMMVLLLLAFRWLVAIKA